MGGGRRQGEKEVGEVLASLIASVRWHNSRDCQVN